MRLSRRALNRTLLARQHLLERTTSTPDALVGHLVGLQAQETMPPFLSLLARLDSLDPLDVTRGLEDRSLLRMLSLRGTVHLLRADDAGLRAWTEPVHARQARASQAVGEARDADRDAFRHAVDDLLDVGPLPLKDLGVALAARFPEHDAAELGQLARSACALVQVPPRGTWKGSGGVVYARADRWLGAAPPEPDVERLVVRYLAAFGPATAADMSTWSGVTRLGPVFTDLERRGLLVRHEDEAGRPLFDVPDGEVVPDDAPAPVRLLGSYDNLWLSHAARDRVTDPADRKEWMGSNGGVANLLLVDGRMGGLWKLLDGHVEVIRELRPLSRSQRRELSDETDRVEALLRLPPS